MGLPPAAGFWPCILIELEALDLAGLTVSETIDKDKWMLDGPSNWVAWKDSTEGITVVIMWCKRSWEFSCSLVFGHGLRIS